MVRCSHVSAIRPTTVKPRTRGCEECEQSGDRWVHLRMCLHCGHVGCCDSSRNRHARKHFHATTHAVVRSFEPGEDWMYCFVDDDLVFVEQEPPAATQ